MKVERVVEDEGLFDVEVSVKYLVEEVGPLVGGFGEPNIFSFVDGLDFESAQNQSGLLICVHILIEIFPFLGLVDLTVYPGGTEGFANMVDDCDITSFPVH